MPKYVRRNTVGFHDNKLPAIEWPNYKIYYVNGRKIDSEIFNAVLNKTYTFNQFIKEENEDVRAAVTTIITENFGNEGLMEFLNATVVHEKTLTHSSGHVEVVKLWKTKEK